MAKTYYEKLKHPKWQEKRLEILKRDGFSCVVCGDKESTLHVHHIQYLKVKNPYDYPNDYLATLCENCHYEEELYADNLKTNIVELFNLGYGNSEVSLLLSAITDLVKRDKSRFDNLTTELIDECTSGNNKTNIEVS